MKILGYLYTMNITYNVVCKVSRCAAEFTPAGEFVALHRETTHPFFQEYARLFTKNHCGKSFDEIKSLLAENGDTLTPHEVILITSDDVKHL